MITLENNETEFTVCSDTQIIETIKKILEKLGEEHLQNHKLQCISIQAGLTIETYSFQRECFVKKESVIDDGYTTGTKRKKLFEGRARDMFLRVCFIRKK